MSDWFETWFDSPYYHLLYQHRSEGEAQLFLNNLCSKLDLVKGSRVLDLACGKGRHSCYLSQLGFNVTGVDLSGHSICEASKFSNEKLSFVRADMRTYRVPNEFDVVLNLFTSFGYFNDKRDNLDTLESVWVSLKPAGVFIIDFFNPDKVIKELVEEEHILRDSVSFHINRRVTGEFIHKRIRFNIDSKAYDFTEKVQLFTLNDFSQMLEASGFEIMGVFGDYKLDKFVAASSPRMIIQAVKK